MPWNGRFHKPLVSYLEQVNRHFVPIRASLLARHKKWYGVGPQDHAVSIAQHRM